MVSKREKLTSRKSTLNKQRCLYSKEISKQNKNTRFCQLMHISLNIYERVTSNQERDIYDHENKQSEPQRLRRGEVSICRKKMQLKATRERERE